VISVSVFSFSHSFYFHLFFFISIFLSSVIFCRNGLFLVQMDCISLVFVIRKWFLKVAQTICHSRDLLINQSVPDLAFYPTILVFLFAFISQKLIFVDKKFYFMLHNMFHEKTWVAVEKLFLHASNHCASVSSLLYFLFLSFFWLSNSFSFSLSLSVIRKK